MKKFWIEDIKVGISEGGMACGPVSGNVIGELKLRSEDDSIIYHCLAEVDGTLNFYESKISTYDGQIEENFEDETLYRLLDTSFSIGFCSYDEFYDSITKTLPLSNTNFIRKYLAYLVRADWSEIEQSKKETLGLEIGTFNIPICDTEADYLEDFI